MIRAVSPALLFGLSSAMALFLGLWAAGFGANETFLDAGAVWLLLLYMVLAERLLGGALFRLLLAHLPLLAGGALLIWTIILPSERIEAATKPELIAGSLIATAWLATFPAHEYQRDPAWPDRQRAPLFWGVRFSVAINNALGLNNPGRIQRRDLTQDIL